MGCDSTFEDNICYLDDVLHIDGISCMKFLDDYQNPMLIYSAERIKSNIQKLKDAFKQFYEDVDVYFAYKACYIPKVIEVIHNMGVFAEVTSSFECKMALRNKARKIIWNSPAKTNEEIHFAIDNGIIINADSISEVDEINRYASEKGINVLIGLRLCVNISGSNYIGRGGKLGVDIESGQAIQLCNHVSSLKNLTLIGLHSHMSVENVIPDNQVRVLEQLVDFAQQIDSLYGIRIKYISCGGGFASRNDIEKAGKTLEEFAAAMSEVVSKLQFHPKLILEPGRYLVNDAAVGIGKIINIKECADTVWWITDMGTNLLVPFGRRRFPVIPVRKSDGEKIIVNVGDRTSSYTGVIDEKVSIHKLQIGDYVAITKLGAYTYSCSQNYMYPVTNSFYMVNEGNIEKILGSKSEDDYIDELYK